MTYEFRELDHLTRPVGEPVDVSLEAFIMDNREWLDEDHAALSALRGLQPGEEYIGGGGAEGCWSLRRTA